MAKDTARSPSGRKARPNLLERAVRAVDWRTRPVRWQVCFLLCLVVSHVAGLVGAKFAWFGLACSRACRAKGLWTLAEELSITPVNITRYIEFDFAHRVLRGCSVARCLDISSPRLFGAFMASRMQVNTLDMVNPDSTDLRRTANLFSALNVSSPTCSFREQYANCLPWSSSTFDAVWAVSVIEHVPEPDDLMVLREMWRVLKPAGRLVLTVPAAAAGYDEFRGDDEYGLSCQSMRTDKGVFFQRWYDEEAVMNRILDAVDDCRVIHSECWGERRKGFFQMYVMRWRAYGFGVSCKDPLYMRFRFKRFASIRSLPGAGVWCVCLEKM